MHRDQPRAMAAPRNLLTLLLVALLATSTTWAVIPQSVAHAQDMDKFRELIAEATKLAFEGKYDEAITKYFEAKTIQDDPLLDYNIARCYHKLNNCQQAKRFYQSVISSKSADEETRTESSKFVTELGECPVEATVVDNGTNNGVKDPPPDDGHKTPPVETQPLDDGMSGMALAGWGSLIGGGVLILSGVGLDVASAGLVDDLQGYADSRDTANYNSTQDTIDGRKTTIYILYGVGALAAAVGGTLLVLDMTSDDGSAQLIPTIGPDSAGAMVRFAF